MTQKEAEAALGKLVDKVLGVREAVVPGMWEVDVEKRGQKLPVFLDYSKRYVITGDVIDLEQMTSVTRERFIELNRIDPSVIPLEDAVVIGDPKAPNRIVVFDDPECPFCKKLHPEMKKVVQKRQDVAFFIKMLPLKIHPNARKKAQAIICAKSAQMLEDSLAGKPIPEPTCETDQIEKNEALAKQIGVRSTPTLVFPDGRVVPGYKDADRILSYLDTPAKGGKKGAVRKN
ncbi:MAG: DsbC family protein [Candidatus Dadabacteria bacterium]|nr:MAG: DsbC family protein [Candidatus Dadabacteria bacterium]